LQQPRYITAYCLISRNKIIKNGETVFEKTGPVGSFLDAAYAQYEISYPKFHKMDNLCKLGFLAAEFVLQGSVPGKKQDETGTGIFLSNSHASLDIDLKYAKTIYTGASPALFVYTLPNIVIGEISIRHQFKGENAFFVFKHFDGKFMAEYVNGLFDNKLINNCICGWVDILKEDYRAILFLIEKDNPGNAIPFTAEQMNQLNQPEHG